MSKKADQRAAAIKWARAVKREQAKALVRRALFITRGQWQALLDLARTDGKPISHYVRLGIDVVLATAREGVGGPKSAGKPPSKAASA